MRFPRISFRRFSVRSLAVVVTLLCIWLAFEAQRPQYTVRAVAMIKASRWTHYPDGLAHEASQEEIRRYCFNQAALIRSSSNIRQAINKLEPDQRPRLDDSVDIVKWIQERLNVSCVMELGTNRYTQLPDHTLVLKIDLKHGAAFRDSTCAQSVVRAIAEEYAISVSDRVMRSRLDEYARQDPVLQNLSLSAPSQARYLSGGELSVSIWERLRRKLSAVTE